MSVGKFFKHAGHSVSKSSKSVGNVFKHTGHDIKKGVSSVYNDGKSAVSYTGKHLIGDVDNISSALSSPLLYIAIGGVALVILMRS